MIVLDLLKNKIKLISILVTREELKRVLDSTVLAPPQGASYKVGDVIHHANGANSLGRLKVYGVKGGGYGFVYIVLEDDTLNPYCLKTFQDRFFTQPDKVRAFRQEAETWIRLGKHPNIVYAHSVLDIGGRPFILLEYGAGSELWSKIKKRPMPVTSALKYAIQLCRGMAHAQNKLPGFVHGDIKPNNCLLTKDDTLKITDFGQARIWPKLSEFPHDDKSQTSPNGNLDSLETPKNGWGTGTPAYMSPEQFDAGFKLDVRSDIYSFGVTLFEMLTGRRPFPGKKYNECFTQHRRAPVPDPASLNADIPRPLVDLVLNCLKKNPAQRPESFAVVERQLSEILWNGYKEELPQVSAEELTEMEGINRGVSLATLERYDDALDCYDEILSTKPELSRVWGHKGNALTACGRFDEALTCFERALALDSQLPFVWGAKGETLNILGRRDEALVCFERALAVSPQLASVWSNKGRALADQGLFADALVCLQRALAIDPNWVDAHYHLGVTYGVLGREEEGITAFKRAIALKPQYAEAHYQLGRTYLRWRRCQEAIESCRQALKINPNWKEAQSALADAYRQFYSKSDQSVSESYSERLIAFLLADKDEPGAIARAAIDFLEVSNFDPAVFYLCSERLYRATGRIEKPEREALAKTMAEVRTRIDQQKSGSDEFYCLGKVYYGLDQYADCQDVFQESIRRFGADDRSLYYIAACNEIAGNYEAALSYYQQALPLDTNCSLTLDGINRMEAQVVLRQAAGAVNHGSVQA